MWIMQEYYIIHLSVWFSLLVNNFWFKDFQFSFLRNKIAFELHMVYIKGNLLDDKKRLELGLGKTKYPNQASYRSK